MGNPISGHTDHCAGQGETLWQVSGVHNWLSVSSRQGEGQDSASPGPGFCLRGSCPTEPQMFNTVDERVGTC
eukprot:223307-Hanusia_phi.AAC.1